MARNMNFRPAWQTDCRQINGKKTPKIAANAAKWSGWELCSICGNLVRFFCFRQFSALYFPHQAGRTGSDIAPMAQNMNFRPAWLGKQRVDKLTAKEPPKIILDGIFRPVSTPCLPHQAGRTMRSDNNSTYGTEHELPPRLVGSDEEEGEEGNVEVERGEEDVAEEEENVDALLLAVFGTGRWSAGW